MSTDPLDIFRRDGIGPPWAICAEPPNTYWHAGRTIHGEGKRVADVHNIFMPDVEAAVANMLAAAPDLYAALKWFIDDIDGTHTVMVEFDANVERARKALAKARGDAA